MLRRLQKSLILLPSCWWTSHLCFLYRAGQSWTLAILRPYIGVDKGNRGALPYSWQVPYSSRQLQGYKAAKWRPDAQSCQRVWHSRCRGVARGLNQCKAGNQSVCLWKGARLCLTGVSWDKVGLCVAMQPMIHPIFISMLSDAVVMVCIVRFLSYPKINLLSKPVWIQVQSLCVQNLECGWRRHGSAQCMCLLQYSKQIANSNRVLLTHDMSLALKKGGL